MKHLAALFFTLCVFLLCCSHDIFAAQKRDLSPNSIQPTSTYKAKKLKSHLLPSDMYLTQGICYNEEMLYQAAVHSLTQSIELNSNNPDAYIERAYAYFEIGKFDEAFQDYSHFEELLSSPPPFISKRLSASQLYQKFLLIEPELTSENSPYYVQDHPSFLKGLIIGGRKGMHIAAKEFIPSTAGSITGIGQALWATVKNPLQNQRDFIEACLGGVHLLCSPFDKETSELLVPEVKELRQQWLSISDEVRGEHVGLLIGKYGIDIFNGVILNKGLKCWRTLRRANARYTLALCAASPENKKIIVAAAKARIVDRQALKKVANLKIHKDKQGKHIIGHKNSMEGKSIFAHDMEKAQQLVDDFAFTGTKDYKSTADIGLAGYKETINFGEVVGYVVNKDKSMIETSWGKIHYSNSGVHIVPCLPKE